MIDFALKTMSFALKSGEFCIEKWWILHYKMLDFVLTNEGFMWHSDVPLASGLLFFCFLNDGFSIEKLMDFVLKTMNFVLILMEFVLKLMIL